MFRIRLARTDDSSSADDTMGVRINMVTDHRIEKWDDPTKVIAMLEPALNTLQIVEDYWRKNDPSKKPIVTWLNEPTGFSFACTNLQGPGSIHLTITPGIAWVGTGGRWGGFMTIPKLRQVHLTALRSIAKCLGATFAAYFADCDDVFNLFYEQAPPQAIEGVLKKYYGEPRNDIEAIDDDDAKKRPTVWYLEKFGLQM